MSTKNEQMDNLRSVSKAMVDAAAPVMENLKPDSKLARWDELDDDTQLVLVGTLGLLLAPIAAILEEAAR